MCDVVFKEEKSIDTPLNDIGIPPWRPILSVQMNTVRNPPPKTGIVRKPYPGAHNVLWTELRTLGFETKPRKSYTNVLLDSNSVPRADILKYLYLHDGSSYFANER